MKCIFCKSSSRGSTSEEHIVPESLGNTEHVLPPGWVCDSCNNYIARKVEAPFLNSWYGRNSRFEMRVPSKRGRIPPATGLHPQSRSKVDVNLDYDGHLAICAAPGEDEPYFIRTIQLHKHGTLYIPAATEPPQSYETSRFIAKVALEILAQRCVNEPGWNKEIVEKRELDVIRDYVRRGRPGFVWPFHTRRIYTADQLFTSPEIPAYEVLHEWDILAIPSSGESNAPEFYAVIAIFGVEYTINLGGPELDGYKTWLKAHPNRSYLYLKGGDHNLLQVEA